MSIQVIKFGGTSVANMSRIKNVVSIVEKKIKLTNDKIVVVVSAMSGVTNQLVKSYKKINSNIADPEYDVILSTGEQYSSALISTMLGKKKINSRSVLGWQIPVITDGEHSKARIFKISQSFFKNQFSEFDVIVVAGFQGLSNDNRITTLGRGGSDTSAVAIAYALGLKKCEIFTDVEGIFTSDPRVVKDAKKINSITYEEILELASLGSKVLHPRSVELAMKYGIKIHVRSSFKNKTGTMVVKEENKIEKEVVTGITSSESDAKITLKGIPDKPGIAAKIFGILANINVNVDMIVQNITDDGKYASLTFTVSIEDQSKAVKELKKSKIKFKNIHSDKSICKVSIVGVGMKSNVGVAQKMFETLAKKNINIQVISTSEIKISVLIDLPKKKIAITSLHNAYGLKK
ncbi:MAG: aspartate kinase [Pelagibacteraceae bacterium TMED65]|nr:aspartate kinase [Rickettsiales bacterium]OUU51218.1 MAG: aspartate kinase [Pelagibacteraceae bacterium TMED65]|tara:strand:+ start:9956 stop:11170 length:1215 start_codon:yes stop_codon:yes gene_type:complete